MEEDSGQGLADTEAATATEAARRRRSKRARSARRRWIHDAPRRGSTCCHYSRGKAVFEQRLVLAEQSSMRGDERPRLATRDDV